MENDITSIKNKKFAKIIYPQQTINYVHADAYAGETMKLLEPIKIKKMELRNRIVYPPIVNSYGDGKGGITEQYKRYIKEIAKNCGLVIPEAAYIELDGRIVPKQLSVDDDKFIPGLRELAEVIHSQGARAALQIMHAGILAFFSGIKKVWGPSRVAYPSWAFPKYFTLDNVQELTVERIHELIEKFSEAARRVKEAGFDAVMIHGAHGYLINQFLSPKINKRTDEWGGSFENRMRFPIEVVKKVREKVGPDFPILYRMNADDRWEGSLTLEQAKVLAKKLVEAGVDAIDVSAGCYESIFQFAGTPPGDMPQGCVVPLAEEIKKVVNVPISVAGRIQDPLYAEEVLRSGKADLIDMGRVLIADHNVLKKIAEGRFNEINKCIGCMYGCMMRDVFMGLPMECTVNYEVSREGTLKIVPATKSKKVLIVGGGPAGMTAAKYAALRGHEVKLYERTDRLGGQVLLASCAPGKRDFRYLIESLTRELKELGVKTYFNVEVTRELIDDEKPDVVILATGAKPIPLDVPGAERKNVVTFDKVIAWYSGSISVEGVVEIGDRVVVIGSGDAAADTADLLASLGKLVTIIMKGDELVPDWVPHKRFPLLYRLSRHGVDIITNAEVNEITEDGVVITVKGTKQVVKADTIVSALGMRPSDDLVKALKGREGVYAIGDCVKPRRIFDAMHEGAEIALSI
jgi:2,4-dienoyl-CoA reductase-like NADH-dependent reductase (Old Yellow Enzyme family)/thioredoxin reductase